MRRKVIAYGHYYKEFLATLTEKEIQKVKYVLSLLETDQKKDTENAKIRNRKSFKIKGGVL